MKEAFEKIKERLEENGQKMSEAKSSVPFGKHSPANHKYYKAISVKKAIDIVNQVAEEYNQSLTNINQSLTNADRIRAMSDEDLAMNMMCPNENGLGDIECDRSDSCNCYECILKWLRSEPNNE